MPKSKEKQWLMGWQVCSPTASVCALPGRLPGQWAALSFQSSCQHCWGSYLHKLEPWHLLSQAVMVTKGLGNRNSQSRTCHLLYALVASVQILRGCTGFPACVHLGREPFEPRAWSTIQCHHQTLSSHHLNCLNTADRGAGMLETDLPLPAR